MHPEIRIVNVFREPYDVYVGNPCHGLDPREVPPGGYGFLGNPFQESDSTASSRERELNNFRAYFFARVKKDRQFRLAVESLRGRRLGCFCHPKSCHAEIIIEYLETI